ncbi:HNH endonuclease [Myceligenerans crystallogenes]|uniref:DUF222 domain-containing protein n=1 Tax=Myceligenerans crystallogenes TaxID=316335 RepID=A0ABN2N8Q6_9MICO
MQEDSSVELLVEHAREHLLPGYGARTGPLLDLLARHVPDLPDDVLGMMVRAAADVAGWAAGLQAQAAGALVRRAEGFTGFEETTTMVAAELDETRQTARKVMVRAEACLRHPVVLEHLSAGRVDVPRADALLLTGRSLTDALRAEAIEKLLPIAPERSAGWLTTEMRKFARACDPDKASRVAAASRGVFHDVCEDEMGTITAFLPAQDSAAVWGVVDDLAQQMRRTEDSRTLGQLRADVFTSILTGRLVPEHRNDTGDDGAVPSTTDQQGHVGDDLVAARDERPIVRLTPSRPVIRVTVPLDALRTTEASLDAPAPQGPRPGPGTGPEPEAEHHDTTGTVHRTGPAWLDEFGPISVATARRIAFDSDAVWHRMVTDPVTGILLDYSTRAYRPPARLAEAVRLRDGSCRAPGCTADARWCDLDHIEPYDHDRPDTPGEPGQTRAENLHSLCRTHHRLKTRHGWQVTRDPDTGITHWTAPTGRRYETAPTPFDPTPATLKELMTPLPRRTRASLADAVDRKAGAEPDPPRRRPGNPPPDANGPAPEAPEEPPF